MVAKKKPARCNKEYQFHDIVDAFPAIEPDELKALDKDIAENGVSQAIMIWQNMICDGRHRMTIADKYNKKVKFEVFKGTELEMIDEVFRRNFLRRHLTSSQRAMAVVEFEKRRGEARVTAGRPKSDDTSATTQEMADMSGTNRTYISQARKVADASPKLADKVASGEITLPEAVEKIEADSSKGKGKPKKVSRKSSTDGDDSAKSTGDRIWKDALGHEIPESMHEFFDEDELFDKLRSLSKQMVEVANQIADKPCGAMFDKSIVIVEAQNIAGEADKRRPYTICPSCKGRKEGCPKCRKLGILNKQQFNMLPAEERKKHGGK